ncbi:hypothetical protein CE195_01920, partial [Sodalis-like symbiont of Philaenus spumarius]
MGSGAKSVGQNTARFGIVSVPKPVLAQHWLWYAYNTKTGGVLAYTFGSRTD